MRTYLVVLDETDESRLALRFAARRAARTGGSVEAIVIIPPPEFVQWGGVQAAMADQARNDAEKLVEDVAGDFIAEFGSPLSISVNEGDAKALVRDRLAVEPPIAALVLGAAATGSPGPLVNYFVQNEAGSLGCPLMIVPGGLQIDQIDLIT